MVSYLYSCFSVIHFAFVSNRDYYSCVGAKMGMFGDTLCNTRNLFAFQWFLKCTEPFKTIPARRKVEKVVWPVRYSGNLCRKDAWRELLSNSLSTITNDTTMKIENYSKFFILKSFRSTFIYSSINSTAVITTLDASGMIGYHWSPELKRQRKKGI